VQVEGARKLNGGVTEPAYAEGRLVLPCAVILVTCNALLLVDRDGIHGIVHPQLVAGIVASVLKNVLQRIGIASNAYAGVTVDTLRIPLQPAPKNVCAELDAARWCIVRLFPPRLVGILKDGKVRWRTRQHSSD
jgi:hypothetical protein